MLMIQVNGVLGLVCFQSGRWYYFCIADLYILKMERKLNDLQIFDIMLQVYLPIIAMKYWFFGIVNIANKHVYVCDNLRLPTPEFCCAIFHDIVSFKALYMKCGDFGLFIKFRHNGRLS